MHAFRAVWSRRWRPSPAFLGSPGDSTAKTPSGCNAEDLHTIPGSGRSLGEGNGSPLPYPCLEKSHRPRRPQSRGSQSQTRLKQLNAEAVLCHPDPRLAREGSVLGAIREGSRAQGPQSLLPAAAPCRSCYWGPAGAGVWRAPCRVGALPFPARSQR